MLTAVEKTGAFDVINGILIGKPQDEMYYEEYKKIYPEVFGKYSMPVLYNVNFGHAAPRMALPYGARARVNAKTQVIEFV